MARYKPGDTVIIRDDLDLYMSYCMEDGSSGIGVNSIMARMGGQPCTIDDTSSGRYSILEDNGRWAWTDEMFAGADAKLDDICIDGDCGFGGDPLGPS